MPEHWIGLTMDLTQLKPRGLSQRVEESCNRRPGSRSTGSRLWLVGKGAHRERNLFLNGLAISAIGSSYCLLLCTPA